MKLFNRNKANKNTEKKENFVDNVKDFKRNVVNKTGVEQQDFFSKENADVVVCNSKSGTKKGLSHNLKKIEKNHIKVLKECASENTAIELMKILKRTNRSKFRTDILKPLIESGFFQLTIPDVPNSPKQKYRLTKKFVSKISKN